MLASRVMATSQKFDLNTTSVLVHSNGYAGLRSERTMYSVTTSQKLVTLFYRLESLNWQVTKYIYTFLFYSWSQDANVHRIEFQWNKTDFKCQSTEPFSLSEPNAE